jgi:acyl-CoA thioesterase-2
MSEPSSFPWVGSISGGERLTEMVTPEPIGDQRFRVDVAGRLPRHLFGGLVAAQSLHVASTTVDPSRRSHSAHGYFLRRGDPQLPIEFEVHLDTDGRSFSARRVAALQSGRPIFTMVCSFQVPEDTEIVLSPMPADIPGPMEVGVLERHGMSGYLDVRRIPSTRRTGDSMQGDRLWLRAVGPLSDDAVLHDCLRFCASDMGTPWMPTPGDGRALVSLDHAMWFHEWSRMDEWHLLDLEPHAFLSGRGFYTGRMWHEGGAQVASIAQENLVRASAGRSG